MKKRSQILNNPDKLKSIVIHLAQALCTRSDQTVTIVNEAVKQALNLHKDRLVAHLVNNNNSNNNNNNNSLYLNTVKTDGSCTADVVVYYNTKQYSTIQYNT